MNSIMKKLSCLVLVVCCFAVATAGDVTYSKKIKNVYSIEEITAKPASRDAVVNSETAIITAIPINVADGSVQRDYNILKPGVEQNTVVFEEINVDRGSYSLTVGGGSYDSEISWDITGTEYVGLAAGSYTVDLEDGTYTFVGYDSWGDGWNGGSASMTDDAGNSIFAGFAVDGSTGSLDFDVPAGEEEPPAECDNTALTVSMYDSWGDGWDSGSFCINDECATIASGSFGTADFCVDMSVANDVSCGGSSYESEMSFSLADADGNVILEGGAPFMGCIGECGDAPVYGCMLEGAPNYNADATEDDGSCEFFAGADYGYWNEYYAGYAIGCGLYYIFPNMGQDNMGDGTCDDFGNGYGLACDAFACDGGDCVDCYGDCLGGAVVDCNGECGGDAVVDECGECGGDGSSCDTSDYVLVVGGGSYDSEISWDIAVSAYAGGAGTFDLALGDGDYVFNGYDSWGDGWNGASATISNSDGDLLYMFIVDGSAGSWDFSLPGEVNTDVYGCMLDGAPNYNPDATIDDGSCEFFVGADYGYWNSYYAGYAIGCGLYYIFPNMGMDNMGNGACDSYGDVTGDGVDNGLACDYFACDGGDCEDCAGTCLGDDAGTECWDGSYQCDEADCPDSCDTPATFNMYDSWGDGWNGATFTMTAEDGSVVGEGGLAEGSYGFVTLCLPDGTYGLVVGGGSYDSEISWDITNADGDVIAGGAAGEHTVVIGAPPVEVPPAPSDLVVTGAYDSELGPVLNMTWSPVDGADYYGVYIWDDTPDEICDDGIDNDGDGYTDCADFDCGDLEECQENCSDGIDNDGDGYTDCEDFDCEGGTEECPCTGNFSWIGDGYCDSSNNNESCGFDGGDCCPCTCVDSDSYDCATWGGDCDDCAAGEGAGDGANVCPDECTEEPPADCEGLTVTMNDAWGDGWNGNVLAIGDESFTLDSGSAGEGCYTGAMDVAVTCGGGSYMSEVSWSISDADGNELLAGGAPFEGCLGTCEDDGGGDECTDNALTVNMFDSWGDGWDSGALCIGADCYTFANGSSATAEACIADGTYDVTCGGSSYESEMSFSITDADGVELLAGGAGAYSLTLGAGDVAGNLPQVREENKIGSFEHKIALESKGVSSSSYISQDHHMHQENGNDREGWINLGYFNHYAPDYDDFTIYGFAYGETALLGVSSVNIAGESDIAGAEGTTPDMAAPYNLQASDDNNDGTVSLTWEYDGFEPVPYPECTGNVSWIGDGWCDSSNNNADCGYDGGDCCADSCDGSEDLYSCDECDADGDGTGCGDQADADGDGIWDSCCDPEFGGDCAEPEPCTSLNPVVTPYDGDENGCYEMTNAFSFTFEEGCGVTGIAYGEDPGALEQLSGGPFYGSFIFFGFGPSETYFFQLSTSDGIESGIFEGTTSDYDCAGDAPEPTACEEAGGVESYIGDGWCDSVNNNEGCGFDGGDCCPCTCESTTYDCGTYGGGCDDCLDPAAEGCPDDCNDDGGEGGDAILDYTLDSGSAGSATFTVAGCGAQTLTVGGGSYDSEITWDIAETGDAGAAGTFDLALADGDYTFNAYDSWGDGWNGASATMTCADGGDVASSGIKYYKYEPHTLHNGAGLYVTEVVEIAKPIVIEQNVDRLVSSFNVYDESGAIGSAFDLLYSVASEGGCWTVTAYDADLDVESGASNEACFDGCPTVGTGDANGDGELNVLDVVVIVGEVLDPSWDSGSCEYATADANGDGELNVLDVVIIVGNILDGRTVDASSATIYKADNSVTIDADGFVAGVEMKISHDENFAIELTGNAMVADYVTKGNTTHLIVVAPEGEEIFTSTGDFTIDEVIAANTNGEYINVDNGMPTEFSLSSAYPNPFNPVTNMKLSLVNAGQVSMNVYNVSGQLVDVLVEGALDAGYHNITWDASNVASGVYFVKVNSGTNVSVQKLMLLK